MKTLTTVIRFSPAIVISAAVLASCAKEDAIQQRSVTPGEPKVYSLTISAFKGGDGDAARPASKALLLEGKHLCASWTEGDVVTVSNVTGKTLLDGALTAQSSGDSTTLKGDLTGTIKKGDKLKLRFISPNYGSQDGTLDYIAANCDLAEATVSVTDVSESDIVTTAASFENKQSIVKFKLADASKNLDASSLTISAASGKLVTSKRLNSEKTFYSGYTVDTSSGYDGAGQEPDKLLDGDIHTKWYIKQKKSYDLDGDSGWFLEFHTPSPVQVDGFKLTNADDVSSNPDATPKGWKLKAKVNDSDEWTIIYTSYDYNTTGHSTVDYLTTPNVWNGDYSVWNSISTECDAKAPGIYQYFRFEVIGTYSANLDDMQLAELQLYANAGSFVYGFGDITVTPSAASNELTVALCNESNAADTYTLSAMVDGQTYIYTRSGVIFENGKYYDLSVIMDYPKLEAATAADAGKAVCSSGHLHNAKTALPAGCTAVGVLGQVTGTGHGLILALQNAAEQDWETIDAWKVDSLFASGTKLLPDDAARGSLANYSLLGTVPVSGWGVAKKADYETIFANLGSIKGDQDGVTYDDNVNACITGVGGTALEGFYWSADESDSDQAWGVSTGFWAKRAKVDKHLVRPVLAF